MDIIILKVGGSACTFKEENKRRAKEDAIRRIAQEIKKAMQEREFRLILVHGAGPFGHKLVSDYDINNGLNKENEKDIEGFVRTHNSMEDLNKIFMDVFREEGLLGFPIQTSACIIQDGKKITKFDTEIIEKLLDMDRNIIPIMYGDMVIDNSLKGSVVSGDAVIAFLAKKLGVRRVLFGTDVDGIYTADPKKDERAELINRIDNENFESVLERVGGSSSFDVTEGMRGKLLKLKETLSGIDTGVVVFNITKNGNTYKALSGEPIGTILNF